MIINTQEEFQESVRKFHIDTEYIVVKPNWVSNVYGKFTEPEILDWLLSSFPNQRKIIIESYTPWRGSVYEGEDELAIDLDNGKNCWDFYRRQDEDFLAKTGIASVLENYSAEYVNITNEYWEGECEDSQVIEAVVDKKLKWKEFFTYIPKRLYEIRNKSTFISLAKIKEETAIPEIMVSMSVKNTFGLIPHPSRRDPFHGDDHNKVTQAIVDMYALYNRLFPNSLWVDEGVKTVMRDNFGENENAEKDKGYLFIGKHGPSVDREACGVLDINPEEVPHLKRLLS